jgi:shikimate kinase
MKKIILSGYMGSGKSLIGKLLADKTNVKVCDLDKIIVKNENLSINLIFETKGEIYFRKKERQYLIEALNKNEESIFILGGGTPCYYDNYLLYENEISIYLKASIATLYDRLSVATDKRPLLKNKSEIELKDYIAKNLFERSFYYNQSKFIVCVDNKTPSQIVEEIVGILNVESFKVEKE